MRRKHQIISFWVRLSAHRVRKRGTYLALTGEAQTFLSICNFGQVRAKRYYLVFSSETRNGILGDKMPVLPHPLASRVYLKCTSSHGARTDATPGLRAPSAHVRTPERRNSLIEFIDRTALCDQGVRGRVHAVALFPGRVTG